MPKQSPSGDLTPDHALVRLAAYRAISGAWSSPVMLACSGGVDSTALLALACEALRRGKVAPFVVAHVDHRTRPESSSESNVVRMLCANHNIPFVALTVSESGLIAGRSSEDVWRERRYDALARAASALGLDRVVTAHTRDDQVETVLMRLFSGSRLRGMSRETPANVDSGELTILRPLLGVARSDLDEVLQVAGLTPLIDPSNVDTAYRRNAVRHKLVPVLADVFPGFESALLRSAELADAAARYCDEQAVGVYAGAREIIRGGIRLDRKLIRGLDPVIASRVIRLAALDLIEGESRELTHERVEAVLAAVHGRTGALIELPYGIRVQIERDAITVLNVTKGEAVD